MSIAKAIASLLAALPVVCAAAGFNVLLEQLEADHAALLAAEQDFRERSDAGELSTTAAADYAAYLQALRGRVASDCLALVEMGGVLPAGSPCVAFPLSALPGLPFDQKVPLNRAERTRKLDAELEAGLGEFDQLLLREQERVRASAPRSGEAGGAAGADAGSGSGETGSEGDSSLAGAAGSAAADGAGSTAQQREAADGRPPGAGAGGKGTVAGGAAPPPDIPDGSDDDVVARQLREAAEQESDPELRDKLWEEYRRYKQGIR